MKKCSNENELRIVLDEVARQRDCPMLLEQYIEIDKEYALLGFSDGVNVEIPGMLQMLESGKGAHHGVTLFGKIFPVDDINFLIQLKQFIQSLHFVGLFDIDTYENQGVIFFNELNLRFGASGYAVTSSGVNLPLCLIHNLLGLKSCICGKMQKSSFFVNEKVAYEDWYNGFISKKDYERFKSKADFTFVKSDTDLKPYEIFLSRSFSIKNRIIRFIRHLQN